LILAGDIGATKTVLALYDASGDQLVERISKRYASQDYAALEIMLADFLKDATPDIETAAFGIPGPVFNDQAIPTNLSWSLDANQIARQFNIPKISFINDVAATAFALPYLNPADIFEIKKGSQPLLSKRFAVVAPGTGLGEAFLICDGNQKTVLPSEGGHCDFAPTSALEIELLQYLSMKFGRVSVERIICGSGLPNVFDFLLSQDAGSVRADVLQRMACEDRARVITELALNQQDRLCMMTMEIFLSVLGSHLGNTVLTNLTTGGVYLAGGVPLKIKPLFQNEVFLHGFLNKGRLSSLLEATPIYLISGDAALIGAARYAESLALQHSPRRRNAKPPLTIFAS